MEALRIRLQCVVSCVRDSRRFVWVACLLLASNVVAASAADTAANFEWQMGTPESQGMSQSKLDALREQLAARKTAALLVIRNDRIVCEWYKEGHSATTLQGTASLAKAIVGGVSCGVAMTDGKIGLDDLASKYIPQWRTDPQKSKITIRHLGSHTSGLEDSSVTGIEHTQEPGWKGEFWKRHEVPNDQFTISRDLTPLISEPGEKWGYSNPGIALLSYAITAAIKDGAQTDIRSLLRERVMRPIGAPDAEWRVGYGKTYTVDGLPLVASHGGGNYTARTAARVGRLMLREGEWEGKRLLSKEAVHQTTQDAGTPGTNGIGWWSNNEGRYSELPRDAYWGAGRGHQILLVVPSLKLIAVRNGGDLASEGDRGAVNTYLFAPLMDAMETTDAGSAVPKTSRPAGAAK